MEEAEPIICPFCDYKADGDYQIMLHMETLHPEGDESPFIARDDASVVALAADGNEKYVQCPNEGCGEALLLTELESHVEMHEEERAGSRSRDEDESGNGDDTSSRESKRTKLAVNEGPPGKDEAFDTKLNYALRNLEDVNEIKDEAERKEHQFYEDVYGDGSRKSYERRHKRQEAESPKETRLDVAKAAWRELLRMPPADRKSTSPSKGPVRRRLGKSELGPHAHEKQMPTWLVKLLEEDGAVKTVSRLSLDGKLRKVRICPNMTAGLIPVLEQLLYQDRETEYAYLCSPAVRHVSKLKREGGFCGYRNIQMLTSYIINTEAPGHDIFRGKIPSIFKIQDYIEHAWDLGINAHSRIETGGVRGTRKYIGTPEAQAMLQSLGIGCDAQSLKPRYDSGDRAYELLYEAVQAYFMDGCRDFNPKVRCTDLPPIYFQHPGHSMTIVGFERKANGSRNLICFDPMFHDNQSVTNLIGERFRHYDPEDLLRAYRRGTKYLRRYNEFEILKLTKPTPPPSITPATEPPAREPPPVPSTSLPRYEDTGEFGA